jgi:hypothetical protein
MSVPCETQAMSDILQTTITPETESSLFEGIQYQGRQIGFPTFISEGFAGGDILAQRITSKSSYKN